MRNRRRSRRYRQPQRNGSGLSFTPVVVILCLSVGCGYATAKYVVDPVVNYVPQLTAEQEKTESATMQEAEKTQGTDETQAAETTRGKDAEKEKTADIVEDEVKVEEAGKIAGYALQFGCYSGEKAAKTAMGEIDVTGLQILQQDEMYKIVGKTYETKEKAVSALEELPEGVDAFVTTIYQ